MNKTYFISFLISLLVAQTTFSQSTIKGKVVNKDKEPIEGAYVFIEGSSIYDISDNNGEYQLLNIEQGNYMLSISYIGYEVQSYDISLVKGQVLYKNIDILDVMMLKDVIINSRVEGQAKALNLQKNKNNITTIISEEQIERFPDSNLGDVLKRVSGINVQFDQGEARFANIRGTSPELNSVTINGERIPSAEAEKRYVQLDLIPADMIGSIEVNKAVLPNMDADAIGGSINLVTKKASGNQKIKGKIGTGYSVLAAKPIYNRKLIVF